MLALDRGDAATARRLVEADAASTRDGSAEVQAGVWLARALLRLSDDDQRGAARAAAAGLAVVERHRASLGATELRALASGHGARLAELGVTLASASGRPRDLLRWAERFRAGALVAPPARPPDDAVMAGLLASLRHVVRQSESASLAGHEVAPLLRRRARLEG
jgi:hypothetical protein